MDSGFVAVVPRGPKPGLVLVATTLSLVADAGDFRRQVDWKLSRAANSRISSVSGAVYKAGVECAVRAAPATEQAVPASDMARTLMSYGVFQTMRSLLAQSERACVWALISEALRRFRSVLRHVL